MLSVGCVAGGDADDDFSRISVGSNPYANTRVVGAIDVGFAQRIDYDRTPRYRAVQFHADAGSRLDLRVRSTEGDAMAWLTDLDFHVITSSDRSSDGSSDGAATISIGSLAKSGDYLLVFRDKHLESHAFDVSVVRHDLPTDAPTPAAVEATYDALVVAHLLPTMEVPGATLPLLAKDLHDRWSAELLVTPGAQLAAYALDVAGQTVWLVRRYRPSSGVAVAVYGESGPLLGFAGGSSELIDRWEDGAADR